MIDCVFLMLIYFMATSSMERQESDLSFSLPGTVEQEVPLELPDEQIIEIDAEGQVSVNGHPYDRPQSRRLLELEAMLSRYREASEANQSEPSLTIAPHDETAHQVIVRVMDAASLARIEHLQFALESPGTGFAF